MEGDLFTSWNSFSRQLTYTMIAAKSTVEIAGGIYTKINLINTMNEDIIRINTVYPATLDGD